MLLTLARRSAAAGAVVWLLLLLVGTADSAQTELIHKVVLFAVLVVVPLGLCLVAPDDNGLSLYKLAVYTQPLAALLTIVSFFFDKGVLSASLASAWLVVNIFIGLFGLARLTSRGFHPIEELSIDAGLLYLPVAGVWLVIYRLGVQPFDFGELIILLTAVHFHFAGFAATIIAGMCGRVLARVDHPRKVFSIVVFAIVAAMPLVAGGITFSPWVGLVGSLLLTVGLVLLAVLTIGWVLPEITSALWRTLFLIGAISSCVAMVLACLYAYSLATQTLIITIPRMAMTHGLLNAFGFVTCSLLAFSQISPRELTNRKEAQEMVSYSTVLIALLLFAFSPPTLRAQSKPDKDYLVYVLSEGADKISLVRFGPAGARIDRQLDTGDMPIDIDGPHGIVVSPDRQFYYVTIAHGRPFGSVWKYSTKDDALIGKASLGYFPATLDVSRDGDLLFVVNFNLHGDMAPSTVSVVSTQTMAEVARIKTCTMPHGSRLNSHGTKQYSACMMDDMLVEIDTRTLKATRYFVVTKNQEKRLNGPPQPGRSKHSKHGNAGHGSEPPKAGDNSCSPTWAEPSADGSSIYVACNASSEIVEINANTWALVRRIPARAGVYNLEVTHDGSRLIATNKREQSVSIYDVKSGKEVVRLATKRRVLHGVVVSPDDRYAFVTVEGVGSEPGTVEVIDLVALKTVATVDVAQGAAGIDFYKF